MKVSAVIPTRGNVDMSEILDSLPRDWQKVVWDNSVREDLSVYGRYAALAECEHDVIYTQDDDCVLDPASLEDLVEQWRIPSWTHANYVVCNMPQRFRETGFYDDHSLVGFGAMFRRDLPRRAFENFRPHGIGQALDWPLKSDGICSTIDEDPIAKTARVNGWLARTCDIVFTGLTPRILVDLPYRDLPWASNPDRMWRQPDHVGERTRMLELVRRVRDE